MKKMTEILILVREAEFAYRRGKTLKARHNGYTEIMAQLNDKELNKYLKFIEKEELIGDDKMDIIDALLYKLDNKYK